MSSDQNFPKRLREAAQRALAPKIDELTAEIAGDLQNRVSESLNQLKTRFEAIGDVEFPEALQIVEEAVSSASAESAHRKEEMLGYLAHFAHDVRAKETQEEILNLLLDGAQRFAPRVALFVSRGDQFQGWSSRGYSEEISQKIANWSCPQEETPLLRDALAADGLTSVNQIAEETELVEALGKESPTPWHAFPMRAIRRPVAVLLAAPSEEQSCDLESLCLLMDLTGLCIENIALKILQEMRGAVAPAGDSLEEAPLQETASIESVPAKSPVDEAPGDVGDAPAEPEVAAEAAEEPRAKADQVGAREEEAGEELEAKEEILEEEEAVQEPEIEEDPASQDQTEEETESTKEVEAEQEIEKVAEAAAVEEISEEVSAQPATAEEVVEAAVEDPEAPAEEPEVVLSLPDAESDQADSQADAPPEPEERTAEEEEVPQEVLVQPEEEETPAVEAEPEAEAVEAQPEVEADESAAEAEHPAEIHAEEQAEAEIQDTPPDPVPTLEASPQESEQEVVKASEAEVERIDRPIDMVQQLETAQEEPHLEAQEEIREIVASEEETPKGAILKEVEHPSEEEKLHTDAKRFARLLVSEIKLYNEKGVLEGKANCDIYARLKRDVDRSRDMYEKRISPIVAHKADYFHDEIIRILADSDPSKLGSEYPGPRVQSQA